MFKKKPFVRFVNVMPGVEIAHPIIRAQEQRFDWIREAALDYKEKLQNLRLNETTNSVSRCPGIMQLSKTGFIIPNPVDFIITTDPNKPDLFSWECPINFPNHNYIDAHTKDQLSKFMPFREDTLKTVVKVNTGWKISASSDIVFLVMPLAYNDHSIFSAAQGILDPHQTLEINVQLFWHKLKGSHLVKAGTPLSQLIPIPRELAVDLVVERATEEDKYKSDAWNYIQRRSWNRDLKNYFSLTKKLFKDKS
jgi:hypothetical protein